MPLVVNGSGVTGVNVNGSPVNSLVVNGIQVWTSTPPNPWKLDYSLVPNGKGGRTLVLTNGYAYVSQRQPSGKYPSIHNMHRTNYEGDSTRYAHGKYVADKGFSLYPSPQPWREPVLPPASSTFISFSPGAMYQANSSATPVFLKYDDHYANGILLDMEVTLWPIRKGI